MSENDEGGKESFLGEGDYDYKVEMHDGAGESTSDGIVQKVGGGTFTYAADGGEVGKDAFLGEERYEMTTDAGYDESGTAGISPDNLSRGGSDVTVDDAAGLDSELDKAGIRDGSVGEWDTELDKTGIWPPANGIEDSPPEEL